jgi:hypothetical protein
MSASGGPHTNVSCPFKTKSNVPRHVLQNDTASDINKCLIPVSVEVGTLVSSVAEGYTEKEFGVQFLEGHRTERKLCIDGLTLSHTHHNPSCPIIDEIHPTLHAHPLLSP